MKTEYYLIAALAFLFAILAAYVFFKFHLLKAAREADKSDLEGEIAILGATTPRYTINADNEAVLITPDGKTELVNYQLKNTKQ